MTENLLKEYWNIKTKRNRTVPRATACLYEIPRIDLTKVKCTQGCATTNPVRYLKFRQTLKGFSSKTLSIRLKELRKTGILERQAFNEIPPRVGYRLTDKGQELVESIIGLLHWMRKWSIKPLEDSIRLSYKVGYG